MPIMSRYRSYHVASGQMIEATPRQVHKGIFSEETSSLTKRVLGFYNDGQR